MFNSSLFLNKLPTPYHVGYCLVSKCHNFSWRENKKEKKTTIAETWLVAPKWRNIQFWTIIRCMYEKCLRVLDETTKYDLAKFYRMSTEVTSGHPYWKFYDHYHFRLHLPVSPLLYFIYSHSLTIELQNKMFLYKRNLHHLNVIIKHKLKAEKASAACIIYQQRQVLFIAAENKIFYNVFLPKSCVSLSNLLAVSKYYMSSSIKTFTIHS